MIGPPRRIVRRHVVAEVPFRRDVPSNDTPVTCTCGEITSVADWQAHRRLAGDYDAHGRQR